MTFTCTVCGKEYHIFFEGLGCEHLASVRSPEDIRRLLALKEDPLQSSTLQLPIPEIAKDASVPDDETKVDEADFNELAYMTEQKQILKDYSEDDELNEVPEPDDFETLNQNESLDYLDEDKDNDF